MRLTDKLGRAQQIVVVVALGAALGTVGSYIVSLGTVASFGWYAYAPLTAAFERPGAGPPAWLRLIIWLALIAAWALASIRVLRPSPGTGAPGRAGQDDYASPPQSR